VQDRQDRREAAAPGDQHQGRAARPQPEVARRTIDADGSTDDVLVVDQRREAAAWHLAHQERDLPVVPRRRRERVAPDDPFEPVDGDARELAGPVGHRLVELHGEAGDVVRDLLLRDHAAGDAALRGARREVDRDADVGPRHALASQDVPLIDLVGRQQVAGLGELLHRARGEPALARAAAAHAAAAGDLDPLAQGGLEHGLPRLDRDRLVVDLRGDESLRGRHGLSAVSKVPLETALDERTLRGHAVGREVRR
jgi:hypothetical protein